MKYLKKKLVGNSVLEMVKEHKKTHSKGLLDFNNRPYDPFHVFASDYNVNCIPRITEDFKKFFVKSECYTCSGDTEPRPMSCFKSECCNFEKHKRGNKDNPDLSPVMELKHGKYRPGTIYLSRPNLSWLLDHPEINFIVRTTYTNNWVLHHSNLDRYDDSPKNIKIVFADWHLNVHRELKNRNQMIQNLEVALLKNNDPILQIKIDIQRKLRNMTIERLTLVEDDLDILRMILEIQSGIEGE